jgi:hypothetical protein
MLSPDKMTLEELDDELSSSELGLEERVVFIAEESAQKLRLAGKEVVQFRSVDFENVIGGLLVGKAPDDIDRYRLYLKIIDLVPRSVIMRACGILGNTSNCSFEAGFSEKFRISQEFTEFMGNGSRNPDLRDRLLAQILATGIKINYSESKAPAYLTRGVHDNVECVVHAPSRMIF